MSNQFNHSLKVPRLYKVAATIAKQVSQGVGSVKHLIYGEKKKHPNMKALYSLVTTLFQKSIEIEILLKRSNILEMEARCDPWLIKILIVELIWGKGVLKGQSKPEITVRGYEQILKAHLTDTSHKTKGPLKPRYVRINTLALTTEEAVQCFENDGWTLSKFLDKNNYDGFLEKIITLDENEFTVDIHIPDLLIFPPKTEFHNHPAYQKGSILLQDKASCLPVHILSPPPGSVVLDMCAAPGMKTTHLAALLKDQGTIFAVEKDSQRFKTLQTMIDDIGTSSVKVFNRDVIDCSAEDFPNVEYILVDPSCSGTGMVQRYYSKEEISPERLQKLAGFQIKILRTAVTKYPNAKRVVYSTCSILPEENEDVVRQVIETNYNFKLVPAKQYVSGAWKNFGSPDYGELGAYCLYSKPEDDLANGFFVAVFERLADGEENKFFNHKIYSYKRNIDKKERKQIKKLERQLILEEEHCIEGDDYEGITSSKVEDQFLEQNGNNVDNENIFVEDSFSQSKKTEKVKNKKIKAIIDAEDESVNKEVNSENGNKKNKKKKYKQVEDLSTLNKEIVVEKTKKMKKHKINEREIHQDDSPDMETVKPKKKKVTDMNAYLISDNSVNIETLDATVQKKKKKRKHDKNTDVDVINIVEVYEAEDIPKKKKTKKEQYGKDNDKHLIEIDDVCRNIYHSEKTKKETIVILESSAIQEKTMKLKKKKKKEKKDIF